MCSRKFSSSLYLLQQRLDGGLQLLALAALSLTGCALSLRRAGDRYCAAEKRAQFALRERVARKQ
jgi:hypothetical protein